MKTKTVRNCLLAGALALATFGVAAARAQMGCGFEPATMKPVIPIGCRDVVHQCACGPNGCYWVWVCVR